ncbi:MAG: hypothetical protein IKS22_04265 [Bacteroidales bacterium]|nr:hypothetical protein [Bacteroidales bacterium]
MDSNNEPLDPTVGRCDHESSCGYHLTPRAFFKDHPEMARAKSYAPEKTSVKSRTADSITAQKRICTIPETWIDVERHPNHRHSDFVKFLQGYYDPSVVNYVTQMYELGSTKTGDVIFYQIDIKLRRRTGKIMKYDPRTGHRFRDDSQRGITWLHSVMKKIGELPQDWQLTQCLFGEQLLFYASKQETIYLVESEKTAVICAAEYLSTVWLATGGKSQLGSKLEVLRPWQVVAIPDVDGYDYWCEKMASYPNIRVSRYLEDTSVDWERERHIDIADRILMGDVPKLDEF